jgi:transcriptional regulator with XRE-family HTH domain
MPKKQISLPSHPVDRHVGRLIRQLRGELGLSLGELEKKADLAPGAVAALEKGSLSAGPVDLVSLSRALKVGPADFFAGLAGAGTAGKNKIASVATSEVEAFLQAYFGLSDPQMRKNLFDMVKAMARAESGR